MKENTRVILANSLKDLLHRKPFNKITVEDITNNANLSRMTFYYYFSDIFALVEWVCDEGAKDVLINNKSSDAWQNAFLNIFNILLEDKVFFTNLCINIDRLELEKYLYSITYDLMKKAICDMDESKGISEANINFIADFYKYAFVGIILDWIQNYMKDDPKVIINKVDLVIRGNVKACLLRIQEDDSEVSN